jgi:hypothetical protein
LLPAERRKSMPCVFSNRSISHESESRGAWNLGRVRPDHRSLRGAHAEPLIAQGEELGVRLESIVSKKVDGAYRSGPCRVWIRVRDPAMLRFIFRGLGARLD